MNKNINNLLFGTTIKIQKTMEEVIVKLAHLVTILSNRMIDENSRLYKYANRLEEEIDLLTRTEQNKD